MSDELQANPCPKDEGELDELLTRPSAASASAMKQIDGDLLILGAGGKMGPSLALLAQRSLIAAGARSRVICVSRFSNAEVGMWLARAGIRTIAADLLDRKALDRLPDCPNVIYMAGTKFGTSEAPARTWALNCLTPWLVAERFKAARMLVLSTGNVYPFVPVAGGGATEDTPPAPLGEYAQSCLGRERMIEYASAELGTRSVLVRLNYATDLRYGVLLDIARQVAEGSPIDVAMGYFNTIWQGDANATFLRALSLAASPPPVLNVTGPEVVSVREVAARFAEMLGAPAPTIVGTEEGNALLSHAGKCQALFGPPSVSLGTLIAWTAEWVKSGGRTLGKPTHFAARDGRF